MADKHSFKRKSLVLGGTNDDVSITVRSRFDEFKKAFSDIDYNSLATTDKRIIDSMFKQAYKAAVDKMFPLDKDTFNEQGRKRRIVERASVSWNIGKDTGKTQKKMSNLKLRITQAKSSGAVSMYYDVPNDIVDKFSPLYPKKYSFNDPDKMTIINNLKSWAKRKKVNIGSGDYEAFAWRVYNSWVNNYNHTTKNGKVMTVRGSNEGKPEIARERALRITNNRASSEAFSSKFSKCVSSNAQELVRMAIKSKFK